MEWFRGREIFQLRKREGRTESTYQHFATSNKLMDPGNYCQWAWKPADEELMRNLTMDGSGWQLLNPPINPNVTEREIARPCISPERGVPRRLRCGFAKNIKVAPDQASGATTSSQETQGMEKSIKWHHGDMLNQSQGGNLYGTNSLASSARKKDYKIKERKRKRVRQKVRGGEEGEGNEMRERERERGGIGNERGDRIKYEPWIHININK